MKEDYADKAQKAGGRILVVTAVALEKDAVSRALRSRNEFDIIAAGVGPVAAAIQTTKALAAQQYSLVINAGIGGGFPSQADIGSLVIASEMVAADLGVETPEGFQSVERLGFGTARVKAETALVIALEKQMRASGLQVTVAPVLTVSTATGTEETAAERAARVPGAAAEAMEGFGAAAAAASCGLPVLEIRAISNRVGLRDRNAWKMDEALDALVDAFTILPEVL